MTLNCICRNHVDVDGRSAPLRALRDAVLPDCLVEHSGPAVLRDVQGRAAARRPVGRAIARQVQYASIWQRFGGIILDSLLIVAIPMYALIGLAMAFTADSARRAAARCCNFISHPALVLPRSSTRD